MKKMNLKTFFTALLLTVGLVTSAQTVSGIVTSDDGPLPGATVVVKGTSNGVSTDFDGNFSINAPADAILEVSFVGFSTLDVPVNGQDNLTITLATDNELDEVVVTGYGSQKKKEITSAVAVVGEEEFNKGTINDASQLLQGKVAGLSIYNKGGNPNDDAVIRLRGLSTLGANASPLVVIDGIIGGSLANLDPSDIESINVLKDGSAAAIYGSRGSAGVLLVQTKKGTTDELLVEYNGQLSIASIANQVDIFSPSEFAARPTSANIGASTDWIDEVTRSAITNIHNISLSEATDKSSYRISANFRDAQGILDTSGFKSFNSRLNYTTRLFDDKLKVDVTSSYTRRNSDFAFVEALRYAVLYNPTAPVFAADSDRVNYPAPLETFGGYFETEGLFDSFNPRAILDQNFNIGKRSEFTYGINLNYKVTDNFNVNFNAAEQQSKLTNKEYYSTRSYFRGNATSPTRRGSARLYTEEKDFKLYEFYGNYNNSFGAVDLSFTGGYSFQQQNFFSYYLPVSGFPDDSIEWIYKIESAQDLVDDNRVDANSNASPDERTIAFFGRLNLTIDDAIFINASFREEGSTKFGVNNKRGLFPGISAGVDLNKYLQLNNVNLLKVRLGYGETGATPRDSGLSQQQYNVDAQGDGGFGSTLVGDLAPNEDLKWEQKAETNFGIEFASDRLSATLDLYSRNITDFILRTRSPQQVIDDTGRSEQYQNIGKVTTQGIELNLNYDIVNSADFKYNSGIVFTSYTSTLDEYTPDIAETGTLLGNLGAPGQNDTAVILVKEGEPIGQIWGPVYSGTVDANGSPIMVDLDGDGTIEAASQGIGLNEGVDFQVLGKGIPDFEIGWTNQLSYGNWEVNAFFRGAFGHSLVNTFRAFYEPRIASQTSYNLLNTKYADDKITTAQFSSLYVEKADFIKLDNLSVNYKFDVSNSKHFKAISASLNGQNLFTITDYTGVDPEPALQDRGSVANGDVLDPVEQASPLTPGIDRRYNYFSARTFTLGLNVKF